jgi:di/tricarboxylate transporter
MVALSTFEVLPTVTSALLAAAATIVLRCCTVKDARRSMEWPVLIAIGASFGLGNALRASGLDQLIASGISALGTGSPLAGLAATYVLTVVITEMITNNAAAVLAFPLGIALAQQLGVSPMPFVMAVMVGASASFLTPIGYQTNLMVYGPGGYKMADYLRFGLPITLATGALALWLIPIFWPF